MKRGGWFLLSVGVFLILAYGFAPPENVLNSYFKGFGLIMGIVLVLISTLYRDE
jgi:hypothetical protein